MKTPRKPLFPPIQFPEMVGLKGTLVNLKTSKLISAQISLDYDGNLHMYDPVKGYVPLLMHARIAIPTAQKIVQQSAFLEFSGINTKSKRQENWRFYVNGQEPDWLWDKKARRRQK